MSVRKYRGHKPLLSVVVPVMNEAANLEVFFRRLADAVPPTYDWELIWVDGGSSDGSFEIMRRLATRDARVKALILSKRFTHQIALTAGVDAAKGDCVVTMDGDLQHPPEVIPEALKLWEQDIDIVFMVREEYETSAWRRWCSRRFYALLAKITKVDLVPGAADFRLIDTRVAYYFRQYKERERFIRGIFSDMGFNRRVLPFKEAARERGTSKYSLRHLRRLALNGVMSFSGFPLRLSIYFGMFIAALCFVYAVWMVYANLVYDVPAGISSVIVGVFFLGGVQLISVGILGEYLMGVFTEVKGRPLYCIREFIGEDDDETTR